MEKNKIKILAIFGKSGSGKNTIQDLIVENFPSITHKIIPYTTRDKRDSEIENKDYIFVSVEEFTLKVLDGSMIEATEFNGGFYGTCGDSLEENAINVGIFNPANIEILMSYQDYDVLPLYINTSDKIRLLRSLNRVKNPDCEEICRRLLADNKDFSDLSFDYLNLNNDEEINISFLSHIVKTFFEVPQGNSGQSI